MFSELLKKIRSGDNTEKKQWLIILSIVSMIIVIMIWIYYMNVVVFQNPDETSTQEVKVDFWPAFGTGLGVTFGNVISNIKGGVTGIVNDVQKLK